MAGFSDANWAAINRKLSQNRSRFGFPVRRRDSVVIGSFNALKLGKATNSAKRWEFLARFASRYDLLAIPKVTDELSGIQRLHKSLGPSFELLVSDTTGAAPGSRGLRERLAYLYRPARIKLQELVSDITYDRSVVVNTLQQDINKWKKFFSEFKKENDKRRDQRKKPLGLSDVSHPGFLTFIRTPHCASFSILGKRGAEAVDFLAINAHTLYGASKEERSREFFALLRWLVLRAKRSKRMYHKNMILLADLNMEFDSAETQFSDIVKLLLDLESNLLTRKSSARMNFPFLDVHPGETSLFQTNARRNQTFDHIAFFVGKNDKGLPKSSENRIAGQSGPNGYDYGVFDFSELFAQAVHGMSFNDLSANKRKTLLSKTKADISDHMPIWTKIPIPG